VDWNAYGRHEELFIKLGETTQSVNVHVLLDCSRSMDWTTWQSSASRKNGSQALPNKWDAARRLAGALGYLALSGGERLFITPFAHGINKGFGPTQGKQQIIPALRFLSGLDSSPPPKAKAEAELARSLRDYAHAHTPGGFLIIISDLFDAAASADAGRGTDWLAEGLLHLPPPRWQVIVMHLMGEQELTPSLEGDVDLQDMETGERLPFRLDEQTLSQYRLRVRRWCNELQAACGRRGAVYARVLAEWPFERMIIPYLRRRGAIQ
jgi:hypothetical protein